MGRVGQVETKTTESKLELKVSLVVYVDIDITILLLIFLTYIDYLKYLMRSKMPSQKILFFS